MNAPDRTIAHFCLLLGTALFMLPPTGSCGSEPPEIHEGGYGSPGSYPGMELIWSDEFRGNALRESDWVRQTGPAVHDRGRPEVRNFRTDNISVRDGYLVIESEGQPGESGANTSSRIETRGGQEFRFARIDVRARLPRARSVKPVISLIGANISEVGWPACGEIGLVGDESRGDTVYAAAHWRESEGHRFVGGSFTMPSWSFSDDFHLFSVTWDDAQIEWLVDERPYHRLDTRDPRFDAFRSPFFVSIELVAGGAHQDVGSSPQWLIVDYIRVFREKDPP